MSLKENCLDRFQFTVNRQKNFSFMVKSLISGE